MSAHADSSEIIEWLSHFNTPPKTVFLNHGEPQQSKELKSKIESKLTWKCSIPRLNESFEIEV